MFRSIRVLGGFEARLRRHARLLSLRDPASEERFRALRSRYADVAVALRTTGAPRAGTSSYAWNAWEQEIFDAFRRGVPVAFLAQRRIRETMVYDRTSHLAMRIEAARSALGPERARQLLREDAIGRPRVVDPEYLTSANRAHHVYHLANYRAVTGRLPWECSSVVEWGGGYGDMARLFRRVNPGVTYAIIDLAPLLALQYVYLGSLEGEEACHVVTPQAPEIVPGKINFIESAEVTRGLVSPTSDLFLSTWAATESPPEAQAFIVERRFFGARQLFLAYHKDANNRLVDAAERAGCTRVPVAALGADGAGDSNEYAFR